VDPIPNPNTKRRLLILAQTYPSDPAIYGRGSRKRLLTIHGYRDRCSAAAEHGLGIERQPDPTARALFRRFQDGLECHHGLRMPKPQLPVADTRR
jgi:hypothetical protein